MILFTSNEHILHLYPYLLICNLFEGLQDLMWSSKCLSSHIRQFSHLFMMFSSSIIEGSALVCIEAFILLHCIIFQCIHTLYGCIIVHSVYYVYTQYKNPQFTCVPLCIRCHCSETKGRVRALWVRSPPCLDGHRQGHQCVVRADCRAGQTDGRPIAELWPEDGRPSDGSRKMVKWWQQLLISKGWTFLAKTFSTHHPHNVVIKKGSLKGNSLLNMTSIRYTM